MSERAFYLPSDDPTFLRQRLAVYAGGDPEELTGSLIDIADEETTSAEPNAQTVKTEADVVFRLCVTRSQAAWLRDVLIALDLGPADRPVLEAP